MKREEISIYQRELAAKRRIEFMWGADWPAMMSGRMPTTRKSWAAATLVQLMAEAQQYEAMLEAANERLEDIIQG